MTEITSQQLPPHALVQPVPIAIDISRAQGPVGTPPLIALRLETPTGSHVYLLENEHAKSLAEALTAAAGSSLVVPGANVALPNLRGQG